MGGRESRSAQRKAEEESARLAKEQAKIAEEEQEAAMKLKADQLKKKADFKLRGETMQGGGRSGLVFGQNMTGVQ